jgi:hypothetical protein
MTVSQRFCLRGQGNVLTVSDLAQLEVNDKTGRSSPLCGPGCQALCPVASQLQVDKCLGLLYHQFPVQANLVALGRLFVGVRRRLPNL